MPPDGNELKLIQLLQNTNILLFATRKIEFFFVILYKSIFLPSESYCLCVRIHKDIDVASIFPAGAIFDNKGSHAAYFNFCSQF